MVWTLIRRVTIFEKAAIPEGNDDLGMKQIAYGHITRQNWKTEDFGKGVWLCNKRNFNMITLEN